MRALAVLALVLVLVRPLGAEAPRTSATGFDHNLHARDVDLSGAAPLPCAGCHRLRAGLLVGRPDHAACFGACHGPTPGKRERGAALVLPPGRAPVCTSCHAEAALLGPATARLAVAFPPYVATDFALAAAHRTHRDVACGACHGARPGAPHRRCAGCHDGSGAPGRGAAMTACTGCHNPAGGAPLPPRLAEAVDTVTAAFSHPRHAARGRAGGQCVTCHASIRDTDDSVLPRPTAATCALGGCHDGAAAFAITTACTTCHPSPPSARFEVHRPVARFSHARHEDARLPCADCHPLSPAGEVLVAGHAPCARCHADDFGRRAPTICGACHNATEPWRTLTADRAPPARTEFGATLDHAKHPGACASCHALRTASAQLRPPRGHRACTGAGCHASDRGPAPRLTACEGCHVRGVVEQRAAQRAAAPWSVRASFEHAVHARARDGGALACTTCHDDLRGASLRDLPGPRKQTCAPCHDGTVAFALTDTACTRCHAGATR